MEHSLNPEPRYLPPLLLPLRQPGGNKMERLTKRVDRLEQDTHQIKTDLAVLTERSQNFATKADVEGLRTDQFKLRCEMLEGFARLETQTAAQFARHDKSFARIEKQTAEQFARIEKQTAEQFARHDTSFARIEKQTAEQFARIEKQTAEQFARIEKQTAEQFARSEKQTAEQFARIDTKFARIDEWTKRADENFVSIDEKFKRIDERFDRLNDRMTWTLLVPAVLAVLGWLAREFWLKM